MLVMKQRPVPRKRWQTDTQPQCCHGAKEPDLMLHAARCTHHVVLTSSSSRSNT